MASAANNKTPCAYCKKETQTLFKLTDIPDLRPAFTRLKVSKFAMPCNEHLINHIILLIIILGSCSCLLYLCEKS